MDDITNSVHEFVMAMSAPTEILKYIKIGIESHSRAPDLPTGIKNPEAVAYIQIEYLNLCRPSLVKIRSLSAKGQVLGLENHEQCQTACTMLAWQHERIQALCYIIGDPSLNWEHSEVQRTLSKVIQLDPEEIRGQLGKHNTMFLTFVKENYQRIFK